MVDRIERTNDSLIAGRYRLLELLGTGGSGSTYRAIDTSDEAEVAIKVLALHHLQDWQQLTLFEREAKTLAQLDHPQIPKYLEYFHVDTPTDRAFYIVQQLAPGKPLNVLVESGWRGTEAEIKSIALQILEILQYLQSQSPPLIHRDLKPHNIVRNDDGKVFLVDFGAVQETYNNTLLARHTVAGTYGYMAPEQFRGRATPASDLYGLGATILYLFTHRSPAELPQSRLKVSFRDRISISDSFADWLETMLEPNEVDRFPSVDRAAIALTGNRYRRPQNHHQHRLPWRGIAAAAAIAFLALNYRYAIVSALGLQPRGLCTSISQGEIGYLKEYLDRGGKIDKILEISPNTEATHYFGGSPLHCAVFYDERRYYAENTTKSIDAANVDRQVRVIKYLLDRGANPATLDSDGLPPLHEAVTMNTDPDNQLKFLKALAATPKHLEIKDSHGESALFLAVRARKPQLVRQLLALGADPQTTTAGGANLMYALAFDRSSWLAKSEPADRSHFLSPTSKIAVTANPDSQQILEILLARKVALDRSPGASKPIECLDCNSELSSTTGDRPLHIAIRSNNNYMVQQFLARGADLHARNRKGRTPLMVAAEEGNITAIELLLQAGARSNDLDNLGLTASKLLKVDTSQTAYYRRRLFGRS
jgi:serine/threonine protein kinase